MHAGLPITLRSPVSLSILAERVYASAYEALENDDPRSAERFFGLLALLAPGDDPSPWTWRQGTGATLAASSAVPRRTWRGSRAKEGANPRR